jgi:predicted lipoprotein with Yx(FWY)xxD motif
MHMLRGVWLLALAAVLALAATACGSGTSGSAAGAAEANTQAPADAQSATVSERDTSLGTILVGGNGMTLYLFEKDTGSESTCNDACAGAWPPLTTSGEPQAGKGVEASRLGTTERKDGSTQVTYAGHPLYFFVKDSAPGDTNGQGVDGFGAEWYVLSPEGMKVENSDEGASTGSGY